MALASKLNQATVIAHDAMCYGCGYNLRGLSSHGHCPECNTPIVASTSGNELCFADAQWLETVIRGAKYIFRGLATAWVLLSLSLGILSQVDNLTWLQVVAGSVAVAMLPACILLRGLWLFAAPEPGRSTGKIPPQTWVRIGVIASAVTGLLALAVWPLGIDAVALLVALGSPMGIVGFPAILKFTLHVEYLAQRCGDIFTLQWAGKLGAFYLVAWSSAAVGALGLLLVGGLRFLAAIVGSAAPMFALFGTLVLLLPYRALAPLRNAQEQAQNNGKDFAPPPGDGFGE